MEYARYRAVGVSIEVGETENGLVYRLPLNRAEDYANDLHVLTMSGFSNDNRHPEFMEINEDNNGEE